MSFLPPQPGTWWRLGQLPMTSPISSRPRGGLLMEAGCRHVATLHGDTEEGAPETSVLPVRVWTTAPPPKPQPPTFVFECGDHGQTGRIK